MGTHSLITVLALPWCQVRWLLISTSHWSTRMRPMRPRRGKLKGKVKVIMLLWLSYHSKWQPIHLHLICQPEWHRCSQGQESLRYKKVVIVAVVTGQVAAKAVFHWLTKIRLCRPRWGELKVKPRFWELHGHYLCTPESGRPGCIISIQKKVRKPRAQRGDWWESEVFHLYIPSPGFKCLNSRRHIYAISSFAWLSPSTVKAFSFDPPPPSVALKPDIGKHPLDWSASG